MWFESVVLLKQEQSCDYLMLKLIIKKIAILFINIPAIVTIIVFPKPFENISTWILFCKYFRRSFKGEIHPNH